MSIQIWLLKSKAGVGILLRHVSKEKHKYMQHVQKTDPGGFCRLGKLL